MEDTTYAFSTGSWLVEKQKKLSRKAMAHSLFSRDGTFFCVTAHGVNALWIEVEALRPLSATSTAPSGHCQGFLMA
jgi:hypothetical protein